MPLGENQIALGRVLFVSTFFKDVMLLGVLPGTHGTVEPGRSASSLPEQYLTQFYTGARAIHRSGWAIVPGARVEGINYEASTRIVGGHVWRGDDCLRPVGDNDRSRLPVMGVLGHLGVVARVREVLHAAD